MIGDVPEVMLSSEKEDALRSPRWCSWKFIAEATEQRQPHTAPLPGYAKTRVDPREG